MVLVDTCSRNRFKQLKSLYEARWERPFGWKKVCTDRHYQKNRAEIVDRLGTFGTVSTYYGSFETWRKLSAQLLQKRADSMPRRRGDVLRINGLRTKHGNAFNEIRSCVCEWLCLHFNIQPTSCRIRRMIQQPVSRRWTCSFNWMVY